MPPDLTQAARPLAAPPHRSCEDAAPCSPPPTPDTAEHNSSSTGGGLQPAQETPSSTNPSGSGREGQVGSGAGARTCVEPGGQTPSVPQVVNMYRLCPKLRDAFAPVGATNSAYSFREVFIPHAGQHQASSGRLMLLYSFACRLCVLSFLSFWNFCLT